MFLYSLRDSCSPACTKVPKLVIAWATSLKTACRHLRSEELANMRHVAAGHALCRSVKANESYWQGIGFLLFARGWKQSISFSMHGALSCSRLKLTCSHLLETTTAPVPGSVHDNMVAGCLIVFGCLLLLLSSPNVWLMLLEICTLWGLGVNYRDALPFDMVDFKLDKETPAGEAMAISNHVINHWK